MHDGKLTLSVPTLRETAVNIHTIKWRFANIAVLTKRHYHAINATASTKKRPFFPLRSHRWRAASAVASAMYLARIRYVCNVAILRHWTQTKRKRALTTPTPAQSFRKRLVKVVGLRRFAANAASVESIF